ncbi:DUF1499 domain-containing protein [Chroococcidiopsis sp.]|uniref:DUF1499 domain-containing protein n=1 Tax=Chroococcidiopsis sp. TaxID=3088168 RepID=UPI003F33E3BA
MGIFTGNRPNNLGVRDGKLAPCPNTPNCVSSQSADASHKVEPLNYTSAPEVALTQLKQVISSLPKTNIVTETDSYIYAEFTSAIMGFVDDVEFDLDRDAQVFHVRSASRLGKSDLGVNRKRIETIRAQFQELQAQNSA